MTKPFKLVMPLIVAQSIVDSVKFADDREAMLAEVQNVFARITEYPHEGPQHDGRDPIAHESMEAALADDPEELEAAKEGQRQIEAGQTITFDNAAGLVQWVREKL